VVGAAAAGGGLALGFSLPYGPQVVRAADGSPEVNAWVEPSAARTTCGPYGSEKPSASPPPAAAAPTTKERRFIRGM